MIKGLIASHRGRTFAALLLASACLAQNPNAAKYPTTAAADQDLLVQSNRAQTTLASGIDSTALSVTVTDASKFQAPCSVTIGNEHIKICSKATNVFTVCSGGRGFNGTTAAAHVAGAVVSGYIIEYHHNQLAAEVKALEADLVGNRHGTGAKFQMFTGSAAANDCAKFDANGNVVTAGAACGSGGGGASMASALGDFALTRTSATVLTIGAGCSLSAPCNWANGNTTFSLTSPATATISAGSGTARVCLGAEGNVRVVHDVTLACSGCVASAGTSCAADSISAWSWTATAGNWDASGTDRRPFLSMKKVAAGSGITATETGGTATVAVDASIVGTYLAGSAAPPGTCSVGQKYLRSGTNQAYECPTVNTWTETTGGAGGFTARDHLVTTGAYLDWTPIDPNVATIQDDFWPLGEIPWLRISASGTCDALAGLSAVAGHPGIVTAGTGATASTACIVSGTSANGVLTIPNVGSGSTLASWRYLSVFRVDPTSVATSQYFAGLNTQVNALSNYVGLMYRNDGTSGFACASGSFVKENWGFVARNGASTETCVDTGVPVTAGHWYKLLMWSSTMGTVYFQLSDNGGAFGAQQNIAANVPTAAVVPGFYVSNLTTSSARQIDMDYFAMQMRGVQR